MSRTIETPDLPDDISMRSGEGSLGDLIREIFGSEPLGMTEEEIEAEVDRASAEIRAARGVSL